MSLVSRYIDAEFEPKAAGWECSGLAGPKIEGIICGGKRGIFYENGV